VPVSGPLLRVLRLGAVVSCDFWPSFFWLDGLLLFIWAFFRSMGRGADGEGIRVKTMGVAVLFLVLGGMSYAMERIRLEWVP
jgi:hypothetical protein